ncbi:uncharacterized protein LOC128207442 [Mya arenaria]|uniref:uncharacterized protein LOC128207442 n=1 Tax=Mya arenaria TaxID=6604 RepID=UPI0022DF2BA4|nr:uncharacterized protein LOC128207442 [Mya arenaria]
MFDMVINELRVYTFLKVLRKTYFKPVFGDRLSTFHFKTAFLFTKESYPSEIWRKNNLIQCVIFCLTTLRRWCRMHYCPHYTITGVNLFVGKLSNFEMPQITRMLSDMIENLTDFVFNIEMDEIGNRMLKLTGIKPSHGQTKTRYDITLGILESCLKNLLEVLYLNTTLFCKKANGTVEGLLIAFGNLMKSLMLNDNDFLRDTSNMLVKLINTMSASVQASMHIQTHQPIPQDIYNLYRANLDFDLTSCRLKFASMLYCTGQYEEAAVELDHTERLLHPDVWQFCVSSGRRQFDPVNKFLCKALDQPVSEVVKSSVALTVIFLPGEIHCVPKHLVYEMYRTFTHADIQQRQKVYDDFTDKVIIESIPFLYYLQYLTHRKLVQNKRKVTSVEKLGQYINIHHGIPSGHIETALNVLGHCMETENRLDLAWGAYATTMINLPNNNAAVWHMAIIMNKVINKLSK